MENSLDSPLSARECAPLIGTSVSALYKMARLDLVPCLKTGVCGRGLRFIPNEVRAALRQRRQWSKSIDSAAVGGDREK
jgi:hypothetical protein